MRAHILGDEVLLDCDLSAQRIGIGSAKKSDVTDAHARVAGGDMGKPLLEPVRDAARPADRQALRAAFAKPRRYFVLNGPVVAAEAPSRIAPCTNE